jgi:hypothetical protein
MQGMTDADQSDGEFQVVEGLSIIVKTPIVFLYAG